MWEPSIALDIQRPGVILSGLALSNVGTFHSSGYSAWGGGGEPLVSVTWDGGRGAVQCRE